MENKYRSTDILGVDVLNLSTPLNAQLELTSKCNYRCRMCYNVWKEEGESGLGSSLTKKNHFEIIDKLAPHLFSMIFSGGEPTLISWLPELISYTTKYGVDCSLITNAALVDLVLAKQLRDSGLNSVQISWHHFESKTNDYITGTKNSSQKTLSGALNLLDVFGENKINVNMVANSQTSNDVYDMGKFLFEKGFKSFSIGILSCSGEAKINGLGLTNQDLLSIVNQLSALHHDYELKVSLVGGIPFCAIPKETDPNVNLCNICDAAIHQIVVGPDGNCRACVESPWIGGNILVDTLDNIWKSTPFEDIRMFRNVPSVCCSCKHVSACHGGCRASALNSTGSVTGFDPLMPTKVPDDFILQNS